MCPRIYGRGTINTKMLLYWGNQAPRSRVCELSVHWIQYGSEKNASLQANIDKHGWLIAVNSSVEHIHDTN